MLTPERLRAIRERCERATEPPWEVEGRGGAHMNGARDYYIVVRGGDIRNASLWTLEDAEFAAHACEDVPALVDEVERLQELKDDYRLRIEHMATALGLIQSEAEALKQAIEAAKSAGGAERLDEIAKHVQAILDVLGRV